MTGICGWFGALENGSATIGAMCRRITWTGERQDHSISGSHYGLAAVGAPNTVGVFELGSLLLAFHGHGYWRESGPLARRPAELASLLASAYRRLGPKALSFLGGDFALALIDLERRQTLLAVDRLGVRNLVYRSERDMLVFSATLDSLGEHPRVAHRVAPQGVYNYVYFHMVPGPTTVFEQSMRLLPGHYVLANPSDVVARPYWRMAFDETSNVGVAELKREFRSTLREAVAATASDEAIGTFLSGGTDSSTVTGVLSTLTERPVESFSIGFDASGYDEMEYARIAAKHFKGHHHEYYVTPDDVVAALPLLAAEYDQPFGNASAVPTYYCAKTAQAASVARMLAGDGGDELFGGNARYARQHQLSLYEHVPAGIRTALIEPLLRVPGSQRILLVRKARSYVDQATMPMPDRYESYNLLNRLGPTEVFEADFISSVDPQAPSEALRTAYADIEGSSLINRMMGLDLRFTLADNDLPKVTRMCDLAGVDVAFPLLHDSVVDFSARLPPRLKLRGTRLRYFFKEALRDFLPTQTLAKQKHGFGLPAGPWLATHPKLNSLAVDAMESLGTRGIFRPMFLRQLIRTQLNEHQGYYGTMVWILLMLELWFQHHVDRQ